MTLTPDTTATKFVPGYTPLPDRRILRSRLRTDAGGVATVTFRGDIDDASDAQQVWLEQVGDRISLYAEVTCTDDTATEIRVAVVPTGKRVPATLDGERAHRIGSVQRSRGATHVYLLSLDGSIDRAAYDAERAQAREDRRRAQQQAQAVWIDADGDDDAPF